MSLYLYIVNNGVYKYILCSHVASFLKVKVCVGQISPKSRQAKKKTTKTTYSPIFKILIPKGGGYLKFVFFLNNFVNYHLLFFSLIRQKSGRGDARKFNFLYLKKCLLREKKLVMVGGWQCYIRATLYYVQKVLPNYYLFTCTLIPKFISQN